MEAGAKRGSSTMGPCGEGSVGDKGTNTKVSRSEGTPGSGGLSKVLVLCDSRRVRIAPAIATILVASSICAPAWAAEIDFDCARLDAKAKDELSARVRLALRSAEFPPRSLLVACDAERAWIVWDGPPLELLQVDPDGSLVERALDTIEKRLREGPARPSSKPRGDAHGSVRWGHDEPTWEKPASRASEPSPRHEHATGGLGVGMSGEYSAKPLRPSVGPRLDVGVGWRNFSFQLGESARFGKSAGGDSTFFYDISFGGGWGAPFARELPVGAVLSMGVEWFNVASHTVSSGIGSLGLRAALPVGPLSLCIGVDGRFRFKSQYIGETVDVLVPRFSVLGLVEGVLLVDPMAP